MARDVFWISIKMRFIRMVAFREEGAHFKRQQVADVVISQAVAWPGHGPIKKKLLFVKRHESDMGKVHFQDYHMLGP